MENKGRKYPEKGIKRNWIKILFNQFHDILAGSSIPEAYKDCLNMVGGTIFSAQYLINQKLWSLSKEINTENNNEFPILFFNPVSFERE